MFDNICSLPLTSDIFAQALHPTEPILSVGLSAGHVQLYRLPHISNLPTRGNTINGVGVNGHGNRGRRNSENGFDVVDTAWRTRRHKGSCRALAFSHDGNTLYSAGTDGIVKVAEAETGRVTFKVAVPVDLNGKTDTPTLLHTLSPQTLLLGTDTGSVHAYDIRESSSTPSARPSRSLRPHVTEDDPLFSDSITSLSPLPPTAASTSGTSRTWVTTAGSTLAVSDLRKGVVSVSEDQGDVLTTSACVASSSTDRKRKISNCGAGNSENVVVGGANGVLTVWERGSWVDQSGRIVVQKDSGGIQDEGTIDALATVPENVKIDGYRAGAGVVVAGLGNGTVRFVRIRGRGGEVIGHVGHDELSFEGVTTLGFDVEGRMISGGGQIVKVWHEKSDTEETGGNGVVEDEGDDEDTVLQEDAEEDELGEDDDSDDSSEDEPQQKPKKRKKNKAANSKHGAHGVLAFKGMD